MAVGQNVKALGRDRGLFMFPCVSICQTGVLLGNRCFWSAESTLESFAWNARNKLSYSPPGKKWNFSCESKMLAASGGFLKWLNNIFGDCERIEDDAVEVFTGCWGWWDGRGELPLPFPGFGLFQAWDKSLQLWFFLWFIPQGFQYSLTEQNPAWISGDPASGTAQVETGLKKLVGSTPSPLLCLKKVCFAQFGGVENSRWSMYSYCHQAHVVWGAFGIVAGHWGLRAFLWESYQKCEGNTTTRATIELLKTTRIRILQRYSKVVIMGGLRYIETL